MLFRSIFFFQAEDGIRDDRVTGVQTCALPISLSPLLTLGGALAMRICPAWSSTLEEFRESLDDGHDDFADDAQVEQDQHQNNAVGFQSGEPVCRAGGQDSHQNAGAVQGRDRQQVEDREHHVDPDAAFQEEQQKGQRIARLSGVPR